MKRLLAVAAFLLASSAAQAQYSFEYGGRTIRIDPDRGTVSIPGVYDNTGRKPRRARSDQGKQQQQTPQEAKVDPQAQPQPQPPPADAVATPAAAPPVPANALPEPSASTANNAPADTTALPPPPPLPPAPPAPQETAAPNPPPPAAPATVAAVPPLPAPAQRPQVPAPAAAAAAAPRDPNSPLGVWLTEEKEGKVRIEQCGANLCGYSVDAKSNQDGEQVLINMKAAKDLKWTGRILDPNTGSTYDSTIALKGAGTLRVQGCAFGGMFCGGQTWTRVD